MPSEKKVFILGLKPAKQKMKVLRSKSSQVQQSIFFFHLMNYGHIAKQQLYFKTYKVT